jgi:hypothetical protein
MELPNGRGANPGSPAGESAGDASTDVGDGESDSRCLDDIQFETDRRYQRLAALALLDNYVRYGEPVLARHILYQLAESHPTELKDAVRQRLSLGRMAFWDGSIRIEGLHFLARDGDRESFKALLEVLEESGSAVASVSAMADPNAVVETLEGPTTCSASARCDSSGMRTSANGLTTCGSRRC